MKTWLWGRHLAKKDVLFIAFKGSGLAHVFYCWRGTNVHEKATETPPIMPLISFLGGSTKIPRKAHENQPRVRRCFECNGSEPRKPTKYPPEPRKPTKYPRKLHERATNSKKKWWLLGSPLDSRAGLSKFVERGHQTCAKNAHPHDQSLVSEASGLHTRS